MPPISELVYSADGKAVSGPDDAPDLSDVFSEPKADGERKVTRFETTPLMSSYVVAFANGDFKYLESSYTSPLSGKTRPLRAYAPPEIVHLTKLALEAKALAMPIYEKMYQVSLVTVPHN